MTLILPEFIIPGAAKSGTTSLVDILKQHPGIFFPFTKEPMFFSKDANYERGLKWYAKTYFKKSGSFQMRGEATPHYLHWSEKTAPRIREAYPDDQIKFIFIFRNPVERAYSWYWNMIKEGKESLPFKEALAAEKQRLSENAKKIQTDGLMLYAYYRGGCYASLLQPYINIFPRQNFLFILQEDLKTNFDETGEKLLKFLGLDPIPLRAVVSNPAGIPRSRAIQRLMNPPENIKQLLRTVIPLEIRDKFRNKISEINVRRTSYPPMDADIRRILCRQYQDEISRLEDMIERDLSEWKK